LNTIDNMTRCLERYLLQLHEDDGRLQVLYPDGSASLSGTLNVRNFAGVSVSLARDAVDAEREACARLCDGFSISIAGGDAYGRGLADGARAAAESMSRMIRSRAAPPVPLAMDLPEEAAIALLPAGTRAGDRCPDTWWP
jgi:hypothetical protein